jgi:hypothetical protein
MILELPSGSTELQQYKNKSESEIPGSEIEI